MKFTVHQLALLLVALAPNGGAWAFSVPHHQFGVARHTSPTTRQPTVALHMALEDLEAKLLGTPAAAPPAEKPKPKPAPAPKAAVVVEKPAPKPAPVKAAPAPPAPKPAPVVVKPAPVVVKPAPAPAPIKKKVVPPPPPPKAAAVISKQAAPAERSFDTVVKGGACHLWRWNH